MTLEEHIRAHWKDTVLAPNEAEGGFIPLPKPFTVPYRTAGFARFYYWDTYFTNLGLLADGYEEQAENNLDNIAYLIGVLGYMPNADSLIKDSQPPFFIRGVYDLWKYTGEDRIPAKYLPAILAELRFFECDRMTPCGLNRYKHCSTRVYLEESYDYYVGRVQLTGQTKYDRLLLCENLLAGAESGWDFCPRFDTERMPYAVLDFAPVDLNSILYDAERKAAEMLFALHREEEGEKLLRKAEERARLMHSFMKDEEGVFYDYDYVGGKRGSVLSAASFYPFANGISKDVAPVKRTLEKLEFEHGIAACENRGFVSGLQWDFPYLWPSNVCFAVLAARAVGLHEDARRVAKKYLSTLEREFERTGTLWEKYDAVTGEKATPLEYDTVPMMGWTAGVYRYLQTLYPNL